MSNNPTSWRIEPDAADLARIREALSKISWRSREEPPDGEPWQALAPATQAARVYRRRRADASDDAKRRRRPGQIRGDEHILQAAQLPGFLLRDLSAEVSPYELDVGEQKFSRAAYGSEFGDAEEGEPSRAFIQATEAVEDILGEQLIKGLEGRWS